MDNILRKEIMCGWKMSALPWRSRETIYWANPSQYECVQGEWIRYSPTEENALFLHKGQCGKQYVYASNKKQFHGDWWAVCQTCLPTSRGQPWTFMWGASLWLCLSPFPPADPGCAPQSPGPRTRMGHWHRAAHTVGTPQASHASESPQVDRKAGRVGPWMLWLALTSHQSCPRLSAINGDMWRTMNGDMHKEWVREGCQKHPNPQQPEHPRGWGQLPIHSIFAIIKRKRWGHKYPICKELRV